MSGFGASLNPIQFVEISDPTAVGDSGFIYTNDVSGRTELMYLDDTGAEVQLTSAGGIKDDDFVLLAGRAAGQTVYGGTASGTGMVIKANDTTSGSDEGAVDFYVDDTQHAVRIAIANNVPSMQMGNTLTFAQGQGLHIKYDNSTDTYTRTETTVGSRATGYRSINSVADWFAGVNYDVAGDYQIVDITSGGTRFEISDTTGDVKIYQDLELDGDFNHDGSNFGALGATPAAQQAHVADPTGGAFVDSEARTAINSILTTLETFGFHATS